MRIVMFRSMGIVVLGLSMSALFIGCKGATSAPIRLGVDMTGDDTRLNGDEGIIGEGLWGGGSYDSLESGGVLEAVYFDYDSFTLTRDAIAALGRNAARIKEAPGVVIHVEGHSDERGTQEYNLALSEKRALVTRETLVNMGIPENRLVTISYGEEDPAVSGFGEGAWSKNRRSEFRMAPGS